MVKVGLRYGLNLMAMVARQEGYASAAAAGWRFAHSEARKLPRAMALARRRRVAGVAPDDRAPRMYSEAILAAVHGLGVPVQPYTVDLARFRAHVAATRYPTNYAGGPMRDGGAREEKLLEYFVSLDLLDISADHVIIDIASEWSIFPEVVRRQTGARVYRQDLIYPPGVHGDRVGGSAAHLELPANFADGLVLHNAYEHFEGTADTELVNEAWRVLKPGGRLCIVPLNISDQYAIVTDPLVEAADVEWDPGATVIELPWWHNRFGRFYDAGALQRRVLGPAQCVGFASRIVHIENVKAVDPIAYLHFGLVLTKP
jgi:SAM-dependent methyltransferase